MAKLEGPGSAERLKRAQQGFRDASRGFRLRDWVRRSWPILALIAIAALYLIWDRLT